MTIFIKASHSPSACSRSITVLMHRSLPRLELLSSARRPLYVHSPYSPISSVHLSNKEQGIMYLAGLLLFPAYKQWPRLATTSKWMGLPLMAVGLIAASFAQTVKQLVLTQGAIYAFGGCIVYYPTLLFIDEWFIQRKGLAYGIMWARINSRLLSDHPANKL